MIKKSLFITFCLISGVLVSYSQGSDLSQKEKLKAEYYNLISTDPVAARKIRDQYMDLVNKPGAKSPFFSFVIGSQWPTSMDEDKFPSRKGQFPQLQACQRMIDAGSDILKICPKFRSLNQQGIEYSGPRTLDQIVQTPFYRKILEMPYSVMLFWAHGGDDRSLHQKKMKPHLRDELYKEFYEFTKHLLTQYNKSGKTFLIGNWEGDWMAGGYDIGHKADIPDDRLSAFREWLDVRTSAIDDAKAATPHENVAVYSYLEVNSTRCAQKKNLKRLVNEVLPFSKVDFVSISSYDAQGFHSWPEPKSDTNLRPLVFENLDYVESMLPPRDVPGKRVFIGEIGYTLEEIAKKQKISIDLAKTEQAKCALIQAKVNMEWGTPLWLWWATFSSHEGTFGLLDNHTDEPSLLYLELKKYYTWAENFKSSYASANQGAKPEFHVFRKAAIEQLDRQIAALESVKPINGSP